MTWNSLIVASDTPCRFWFSEESSLLTPLIWKVAPRVPVPLKLIEEPEEAVGLFWPEVGFSWKPAKVSARERKLPWLSAGLSLICFSLSEPLISALTVLIWELSATTTTSAATLCVREKLATVVLLRVTSTRSRTTVPKPASEAATR